MLFLPLPTLGMEESSRMTVASSHGGIEPEIRLEEVGVGEVATEGVGHCPKDARKVSLKGCDVILLCKAAFEDELEPSKGGPGRGPSSPTRRRRGVACGGDKGSGKNKGTEVKWQAWAICSVWARDSSRQQ